MAYFSNGTEGLDYACKYCDNCVNYRGSTGEIRICPILQLHHSWNYEQCDDEDKKFALDLLIPRQEDGTPGKCRMFVPLSGISG